MPNIYSSVSLRKPTTLIYAAGVLLLLVAGGIWWGKVSTNPSRVFWGTINQSLETTGVAVQATQNSGATTADQTVQYSLGVNESSAVTTLTQGTTTVVDETYGTPTADYTRYLDVKTNQKSASGKPLDFSSVTGVWAKSDGSAAAGKRTVILSQAALGTGLPLGGVAVPIADLTPKLRAQLVDQIRSQNVYQVAFDKVQKTHKNGRLQYVYSASVQPILYASMMKSFAKVVGLHDFDQLDPNSFSGQQNLVMQLTVDVRSHHVVNVTALNGQINQTYSAYDVPVAMPKPSKTITASELQSRLTALQK